MYSANPPSSGDQTLRTRILLALAADNRFESLAVHVGVKHGIAHLGGELRSLQLREALEQYVAAVPGIRAVVNRLAAPGAPSPGRNISLDI